VCNQFSGQLIPDSLCSFGWQQIVGVIILASVGFLYIENLNFLSLQCIVKSKRLICSCSSFSMVNFVDGCKSLNLLVFVQCLLFLVLYYVASICEIC
jgi:hypothetical protein